MPVAHRDLAEGIDAVAAYLKFSEDLEPAAVWGCLFAVDGYGEPLEFCFNRVTVPSSFLWRPGEAKLSALRKLCVAIFSAVRATPDVLFALSDELPAAFFQQHLEVGIPTALTSARVDGDGLDGPQLFWVAEPPASSIARLFVEAASARGALMEPFSRADAGLAEAFRRR